MNIKIPVHEGVTIGEKVKIREDFSDVQDLLSSFESQI